MLRKYFTRGIESGGPYPRVVHIGTEDIVQDFLFYLSVVRLLWHLVSAGENVSFSPGKKQNVIFLIISKGSEEKRNHPKIIPCVPRGLGLEMFCKIDKARTIRSVNFILWTGAEEHMTLFLASVLKLDPICWL